MGPDGTPWATVSMACPKGVKPSAFCPKDLPDTYMGVVGHLYFPDKTVTAAKK